jgi:hypothetical protein
MDGILSFQVIETFAIFTHLGTQRVACSCYLDQQIAPSRPGLQSEYTVPKIIYTMEARRNFDRCKIANEAKKFRGALAVTKRGSNMKGTVPLDVQDVGAATARDALDKFVCMCTRAEYVRCLHSYDTSITWRQWAPSMNMTPVMELSLRNADTNSLQRNSHRRRTAYILPRYYRPQIVSKF